jgi:hypothetical protein
MQSLSNIYIYLKNSYYIFTIKIFITSTLFPLFCFLNLEFGFHTTGFVLSGPGYPSELIVECKKPPSYPHQWYYEIWLQGKWSGLESITSCFDPNLCYDKPPALPTDFSVKWNQSFYKHNTLNTSLVYSCVRDCKE